MKKVKSLVILLLIWCTIGNNYSTAQVLEQPYQEDTEGYSLEDTLNCNTNKEVVPQSYWSKLKRKWLNPPSYKITFEEFQYENYFKSNLERTFYLELRKDYYYDIDTHYSYEIFYITKASLRAHAHFGFHSREELINTPFFCLLSEQGIRYFQKVFNDYTRGCESSLDVFETDVIVKSEKQHHFKNIEWIFMRLEDNKIFLQGTSSL